MPKAPPSTTTRNPAGERPIPARALGSASVLVAAAGALLAECESFVGGVDDRAYGATSAVLAGGTIGKHLRHLVDHFTAITIAHEAEAPIDYDHRERDVPMESDRGAALRALRDARLRIGALTETQTLAGAVRVRVMIDGSGTEIELGSTLWRELAFATHHAVHHCAMMRAIALEQGVDVAGCAPVFGIAPSTAHHERGR